MKNENLDSAIKNALEEKVKNIQPSPFMIGKIKTAVSEKRREKSYLKFLQTKKLAVIGSFCFATVTCFAAVKFSGVTGHTSININKTSEIDEHISELGFTPKYVEAFDNGFEFENGGTGETYGNDENGDPSGNKYKTLSLTYKNKDGDWVSLGIDEGNPYVDMGVEYTEGYSSQVYKFVPPDYTLTEEDKQAEADGSLVISYGSSEVEINTMENYIWQDGGLYYSLTASDCSLGEKEMAEMAQQVKESK